MPMFSMFRHPVGDSTKRLPTSLIRLVATLTLSVALTSCGGGGGGDSSSSTDSAANSSTSVNGATNASTSTGASSASSATAASAASTSTASAATTSSAASAVTAASAAAAVSAPGPVTSTAVSARALPISPSWTAYYGPASNTDLTKLASTFNLLVIDADPDLGSFTNAQIAQLKSSGMRVLSYLDFGSCENFRTYYATSPSGFVSCTANTAGNLGRYDAGSQYDEDWMNPANADYQNLVLNYIAPRLVASGVDGFMLDNFEIVGHTATQTYGPCNAACAQGGLDLVAKLRARYPNLSIVLNNAPAFALNGSSGGVSFPTLVDGVLAEDAFDSQSDPSIPAQLTSWLSLAQNLGNKQFFVGTLDYEPTCGSGYNAVAQVDFATSKAAGFSPSVETTSLNTVCWWPFLPTSP